MSQLLVTEDSKVSVISGCIYSGKTRQLIFFSSEARFSNVRVQVFKYMLDDRYAEADYLSSHSGEMVEATPISKPLDVLRYLDHDTHTVVIDECQFFDESIVGVVQGMANSGLHVVLAGRNTNSRGEPFGPMPYLMSIAEESIQLKAICSVCKQHVGDRTQRLVNGLPALYSDGEVVETMEMEARCRAHHQVPRSVQEQVRMAALVAV